MPKVTDEHRQEMRLRIQNAALACFIRKGFTGASMSDIIKEAGLSAGAVYIYYSSKAELTIDVGRRIMEQRVGVLGDFAATEEVPPPHVVFPQLLGSIVDDNPFAPLVLQVWGEASHDSDFTELARQIFGDLSGHFEAYLRTYFERSLGMEEAAASARANVLVPAVLALMQGSMIQIAILGEDARQRVATGLETLLADLVA